MFSLILYSSFDSSGIRSCYLTDPSPTSCLDAKALDEESLSHLILCPSSPQLPFIRCVASGAVLCSASA